MEAWIPTLIAVFGSVVASSGFWAWLQKRGDKYDVKTQMLLGLAHDRIVYLSVLYIDRGNITKEEFENLDKYLYAPYKKLGGNGTITRLVDEVRRLPITSSIYHVNPEEE